MDIHLLSDLHLEFAPFVPPPTPADVVVLCGDIGVGTQGITWAQTTFPHVPVIYVPGNHEFYGTSVERGLDLLRRAALGSNVVVLDEDTITLGGVRFVGATLWTDFGALGDDARAPLMLAAGRLLNDYEHIQHVDGSPLLPQHTHALHLRARSFLQRTLARRHPGPTVVVSHHAPVRAAFPKWLDRHPAVVAGSVNRLETMLDASAVTAWFHGHTHWCHWTNVRKTAVVSNQRGYPRRLAPGFVPGGVVTLGAQGARPAVGQPQTRA